MPWSRRLGRSSWWLWLHKENCGWREVITPPRLGNLVLWYRSFSLFVCLFARNEDMSWTTCPTFIKFLCMLPVVVARSFCVSVAICYVLLVLWMTCLLWKASDTVGHKQLRTNLLIRWQHRFDTAAYSQTVSPGGSNLPASTSLMSTTALFRDLWCSRSGCSRLI